MKSFIIFAYFHTFGLILQNSWSDFANNCFGFKEFSWRYIQITFLQMIVWGLRTFLGGSFKGHFLEVCDTFFGCFLGFIFFEVILFLEVLGLIFKGHFFRCILFLEVFGLNFQKTFFGLNFEKTLFRDNIQMTVFGGIF